MAVPLPTFKPPYAITCWADATHIFVELPTTSGPPYITKYPFTEAGLSKALWLMRSGYEKAKPTITGDYSRAHPLIKHTSKAKAAVAKTTDEQRASARNVLKKMGIIS